MWEAVTQRKSIGGNLVIQGLRLDADLSTRIVMANLSK
jgi:hypothetical protein